MLDPIRREGGLESFWTSLRLIRAKELAQAVAEVFGVSESIASPKTVELIDAIKRLQGSVPHADGPPPLSATEIRDSGLLHVVNERLFWPLGLALTVSMVDGSLTIETFADEIVTGLTPEEHRARHRAFEQFERNRKARLLCSDEQGPSLGNTCTCPTGPMPGHYVGCPLAGNFGLPRP